MLVSASVYWNPKTHPKTSKNFPMAIVWISVLFALLIWNKNVNNTAKYILLYGCCYSFNCQSASLPSSILLGSSDIEISEKGSFPLENISHIKTPKLQTSEREEYVSVVIKKLLIFHWNMTLCYLSVNVSSVVLIRISEIHDWYIEANNGITTQTNACLIICLSRNIFAFLHFLFT